MTQFGTWIRSHRKELNLLQSDVATKAGVSTSYISTLERGQKHSLTGADLTPERDKVIAIAKAVKGDIDEALELCGYSSQSKHERYQLPEGVNIYFDSSSPLTDEEKDKLLDFIKTMVAGVRSGEGQ